MRETTDTGIEITAEQYEALKQAVEAGDYTTYHYLKSQYGSHLSTLYVPGPTGQGIFGTLSHEYTKQFVVEEEFAVQQTRISDTIANHELDFIEQTKVGTTYRLPSVSKTLELEIQSWKEVGLPAESYAGNWLDGQIAANANGVEISATGLASIIAALGISISEQVTGDIIVYKGVTYNAADLIERDGFYYAQDGERELVVGINNGLMLEAFRSVVQTTFIELNPSIFLGTQNFPLNSDGEPRDAVALQDLARDILGEENYQKTLAGLRNEYRYDEIGNLISTTAWSSDGTRTHFAYDPQDNEAWSERSERYDNLNRITGSSETLDDGSRSEQTFDPDNGETLTRKDFNAAGQITYDSVEEARQKAEAARIEAERVAYNQLVAQKTVYIQAIRNKILTTTLPTVAGRPGAAAAASQLNSNLYAYLNEALKGPATKILSTAAQLEEFQGNAAAAYYKYVQAPYAAEMQRQREAAAAASAAEAARRAGINAGAGNGNGGDYYSGPSRGWRFGFDGSTHLDTITVSSSGRVRPILLDLNGDDHIDLRPFNPAQLTAENGPRFDWDKDGVRDGTAWVGADDGFLAIDADSDGLISQSKELAFTQWLSNEQRIANGAPVTDLDALRLAFDTNGDNILDAHDARWSEFRVWQDANQNGVSDAGELKTLSEAGIKLINLMPEVVEPVQFADGSIISAKSSYETVDGARHLAADAALIYRSSYFSAG